jgi:two-component system response regulator
MNASADTIDVLLVEDNPDDAEFTLRALRRANVALNVAHVENGVVALEFMFATGSYTARAGATLPRVVLLDLKIPRVDGHEVLRRIKSDPRTRLQPVVVLTSSRERRDIEASYAVGANSYIVKPVDYPDLVSTLGALTRYWLQMNERPA